MSDRPSTESDPPPEDLDAPDPVLSDGDIVKPGAAVYLWHCDRDGLYSLYTVPDQNYLRGVQAADASGEVTFTSIFPA